LERLEGQTLKEQLSAGPLDEPLAIDLGIKSVFARPRATRRA
jgi:hypothetical protein